MCGIVGVLSFGKNRFNVTEPYLVGMRDRMVHRGPDGAGAWISPDRQVGLGHRRLAIIDLSDAALQPMCNEDRTLWIVFNGEIYNHAEIRRELEQLGGHTWKTDHSDTEVILHAFEQWGIDCIKRFRGMFAFALWDSRNREMWLARDRIGIKPLCYSIHHDRIVFASEMKALLQDREQDRQLDEETFYHYLTFLTSPGPQTLFAGIKKLQPGCWLRISADGNVTGRRYWDVWDNVTPMTGVREEEVAERILSELRTSVKLRKISDVPVGVFLSGGIDSSTNTKLFSEGEGCPVKTFSIGYEGDYKSYANELHHARRMADFAGSDHHELLLTQRDLIDFLPKMVSLQDEPIADPVCFPVYFVSKLARDNGVVVCQVGEGADELFFGYPNWKERLKYQHYGEIPLGRQLSSLGLAGLRAAHHDEGFAYELLSRNAQGRPIFWSGSEAFTETLKMRLLSPRLKRKFRDLSSWQVVAPLRAHFEEKAWETSHLQWMSYLDLNIRLPELLLMRVDKMSMGVSLEARVPFLDHKFVELAMSIPESLKTKNGTLKYILKKAVRGVIPDDIIDRPKQGFGVPVYEWFVEELGQYAREELTSFCKETDLLDRAEVMRLLDNRKAKETWNLLNVALWWKTYICEREETVQATA